MPMETVLTFFALFGAMALQVIVPPLPAEIIAMAAGRAYGPMLVTVAGGSGLCCGSLVVYLIGRRLADRYARFFDRGRVRRVVVRLREHQRLLLWVRLLPYNPSDLISYVAGIIAVPFGRYLLITCCTAFLRTALLASLGASLVDAASLLRAGSLLLLSAAIGAAVAYGRRSRPVADAA